MSCQPSIPQTGQSNAPLTISRIARVRCATDTGCACNCGHKDCEPRVPRNLFVGTFICISSGRLCGVFGTAPQVQRAFFRGMSGQEGEALQVRKPEVLN